MLLPGCQCCGTCEQCTRECTEPHSGPEFEVVYTRKVFGNEAGNPSDGYLTATGDSDSSDPYNGMDGTGPWFQQVGGAFEDGGIYGGGTRFPCTYRFSFWRSSYTLGPTSPNNPPSTALTRNVIELTVSAGAIVYPDGTVITPASGTVTLTTTIPLVSGGASATDPRTNEGTVSFALQCQNVETQFSVQARIEWNTQKRQHTVYGIVRECYEIGTPCDTACSGSAPPNTIYLEIKNVSLSGGATVEGLAGTYVMTRAPNFCDLWEHYADLTCSVGMFWGYQEYIVASSIRVGTIAQSIRRVVTISGVSQCVVANLNWLNTTPVPICGTGVIKSGTGGQITFANGAATTGTFDWEISA